MKGQPTLVFSHLFVNANGAGVGAGGEVSQRRAEVLKWHGWGEAVFRAAQRWLPFPTTPAQST